MAADIIDIDHPEALDRALELLARGDVIAFPTDTVYGVGAAALRPAAVAQLYTVKERPPTQAIPILLAEPEDLKSVCSFVPPIALDLAARYWPGGLTLVLPAAASLPSVLLGGGATVAVRVPDHARLQALIRRLGQPLAATSANIHGGPNPSTAEAVFRQIGSRLPLILDGGATAGDIPSTIVDITGTAPQVLRQGALRIVI
jgi:L-threonylcarbamoyladenylate synthase